MVVILRTRKPTMSVQFATLRSNTVDSFNSRAFGDKLMKKLELETTNTAILIAQVTTKVVTSAHLRANSVRRIMTVIVISSFVSQIIFGSIARAELPNNDARAELPNYNVSERTISRADGTTKPLDLSPETIRRAIRSAELERVAFHASEKGRIPGEDGPWATGSERARAARVAAVRVMTIDANDQATCRRVAQDLTALQIQPARPEDALKNLCNDPKRKGNLARIVVMESQDPDEFQINLDASFLTNTDRTLANDTRNLALGMAGTMGVLWSMPESVTKWDKNAIRSNPGGFLSQYQDNIRRGPVIDEDDWAINYIGHPVAGAAYYTLSRHNGKSPLESFGYSVAMSTFFWEYGFEAFAEIPSIQDLIITPVIGAILGEVAYQYEQQIRNNGGKLLGSKGLGSAAMIVLNPAGALSDAINSVLGAKVIKSAKADLVLKRYRPTGFEPGLKTMIGIKFTFLF